MNTSSDRCPLVTRRSFLVGLGSTVVLAACSNRTVTVLTSDTTSPSAATGATPSVGSTGGRSGRVLVVVEMGGGNDGLNTVVPHGNSRYFDLRQSIRIEDPIDLDGEIGLHPALERLADRYRKGQVAVVEGVGVPDPDLSHFVSMETWWTGRPEAADHSGWLGRYLDGAVGFEQPLAGITLGPGPSRAMLGNASYVVAIQDSSGLAPNLPPWIDSSDELMATWEGFAAEDARSVDLDPVRHAIEATAGARDDLSLALGGVGDGRQSRGRVGLASELELAAQLITSDVSPEVVYIHGFGDFDTHQGEVGRHRRLMSEFDGAIDRFFGLLEDRGHADRVMLITTSEFGRRARDNGSGTDHGTAAAHLVIGPSVTGGRYGRSPDLAALDPSGNLVHTVDYRSLYATALDSWLSADADEILGSSYERLGFV